MSFIIYARFPILGYAIIQLPDMLVFIYVLLKEKLMTSTTDILDTQSRSPNPITLTQEETRRYDCVGLVDANIFKAIKEEEHPDNLGNGPQTL